MEDGDSHMDVKRWENLDPAILLKIYKYFGGIYDLTSAIANVRYGAVCSSWRSVFCHPQRWSTLDLSRMKSSFIHTPLEPYVFVHSDSDSTLSRFLKVSLSLSRGNIVALIFNVDLYVHNDLFTYTAERCPKLKLLVMPAWNRIEKTGIRKAFGCWKDLESLTMPNIKALPYVMKQISNNCNNFRELKIMGTRPIQTRFASKLVVYLPNLKVLSLRCTKLMKDVLIIILDGLLHLEVLNISHCLVIEVPPLPESTRIPPKPRRILKTLDQIILDKALRLRSFITCRHPDCIMCQRTRKDRGILRWSGYEDWVWKEDEVNSLNCSLTRA